MTYYNLVFLYSTGEKMTCNSKEGKIKYKWTRYSSIFTETEWSDIWNTMKTSNNISKKKV